MYLPIPTHIIGESLILNDFYPTKFGIFGNNNKNRTDYVFAIFI